jgi:hypothetical protein
MRVSDADAAILSVLEADLLRDDVAEAALTAAVAEIQRPEDRDGPRITTPSGPGSKRGAKRSRRRSRTSSKRSPSPGTARPSSRP